MWPPHPDADLAANLIWSAKESALKVLTTGLAPGHALRRGQCSNRRSDGWQRLQVVAAEGVTFHGWWRRYGTFVLTVASAEPVGAPAALDAPPLLDSAVPSHGWLAGPRALADRVLPRAPCRARPRRPGTDAGPAPG